MDEYQLIARPYVNERSTELKPESVGIEVNRDDVAVLMEEIIALANTERGSKASQRLADRIVDSFLWKAFKMSIVFIVILVSVSILYFTYLFYIKDDVDNVVDGVRIFVNEIVELMKKLVEILELTYALLDKMSLDVEKAVHDLETQVMNSEDDIDALILAVN